MAWLRWPRCALLFLVWLAVHTFCSTSGSQSLGFDCDFLSVCSLGLSGRVSADSYRNTLSWSLSRPSTSLSSPAPSPTDLELRANGCVGASVAEIVLVPGD